jgi:hypothetical protein
MISLLKLYNGVGSFISWQWMMDDQIFYLVLNATFSYIVIKYFIWILTPLSVISWWRKPDSNTISIIL